MCRGINHAPKKDLNAWGLKLHENQLRRRRRVRGPVDPRIMNNFKRIFVHLARPSHPKVPFSVCFHGASTFAPFSRKVYLAQAQAHKNISYLWNFFSFLIRIHFGIAACAFTFTSHIATPFCSIRRRTTTM